MTDPNEERRLLALSMMENGPTWELLRRWTEGQQETLLRDLEQVDPSDHGRLAWMQGRISVVRRWLALEQTVSGVAKQPPQNT